jgi:hypothetical protein
MELRRSRDAESGGRLGEADLVAGRVAERAVPNAVRLVDRLLQHVGPGRADRLERGIDVLDGVVEPASSAIACLSSGEAFGLATGGSRMMLMSGWDGGPMVVQRMPSYLTSLRTSKPSTSR